MGANDELEVSGHSRRDFLKKSAAAGAVAWAAPSILSLPGARAWAAQYGCPCNGNAYGLKVVIPALGVNATFPATPNTCLADTGTLGATGTATVRATVVCDTIDTDNTDNSCGGTASIATLTVVVGNPVLPTLKVVTGVLTSSATASCPCSVSGSSTIANAAASGSLLGGTIDLDAIATCNTDVLGLGAVVINEQRCNGDTLSVNALHIGLPSINSPSILEVVVAHSEASATGCPCTECS